MEERRAQPTVDRATWLSWVFAEIAYFVSAFNRTSLGVASLKASYRLHVGPGSLAVFAICQLGAYALLQVPAGTMADRFGPRRMLVIALLIMGLGQTIFGFSDSFGVAVLGRSLVGVGDALTFVSVLRFTQDQFPSKYYGLLAALTVLVGGVGFLLSTYPLYAVLARIGWTSTFGSVGVLTGLLALPVAIGTRGSGWRTPSKRQVTDRVRDSISEALRNRATLLGFSIHFVLVAPVLLFLSLWGYPYLVNTVGYSPTKASLALSFAVFSSVLVAPCVGLFIRRLPQWRLGLALTSGGVLMILWLAILAVSPRKEPAAVLIAFLFATGLANSTSVVAFDIAREANPFNRGGMASGMVNVGGFAGAALASIVIGSLLSSFGFTGRLGNNYRQALFVVPGIMAVGLCFVAVLGRPFGSKRRSEHTSNSKTTPSR